MTTQRSAIREAKDQLFLNRAVGEYLSHVSSNIGLERPVFGFHNDAVWRAVARRLALDYRQIRNLFEDLLSVILGPRITVSSVMSVDAALGDESIYVTDPGRLPQCGTVVINEGLVSVQSIKYMFLDPLSGQMWLETALTSALTAVDDNADGALLSDVSAGATALTLVSATKFPTSGFPHTLLINPGQDDEEVVQLTAHSTPSSPLTVSALTKDHSGLKPTPVVSELERNAGGGTTIILESTANFPKSGVIKVKEPGALGLAEIVEFYLNDVANSTLYLKNKISLTYTTGSGGASVTLMRPTTVVQLGQLQVKGVGWKIFQTIPRKMQIYIPPEISKNRLLDASYLHDVVTAPSTTVGTSASIGDTRLYVADASGFPSAGAVIINSSEKIGYNRIDRFSTSLVGRSGATVLAIGISGTFVADVTPLLEAAGVAGKSLILSRGTVRQETLVWKSVDPVTNYVTFALAATQNHLAGDAVEVAEMNTMWLTRGLTSPHASGQSVALYVDAYPGTSLAIGDPRVSPANSYRFQGHYTFQLGERAPSSTVRTTITENLAGPVYLLQSQIANRGSLEVQHAELFESTGLFSIRIGFGFGSSETIDTSAVTLWYNATGLALTLAGSIGDMQITMSTPDANKLPHPGAGSSYGYRLLIDEGSLAAEIVIVRLITGGVVYLEEALTQNHLLGATCRLVADVISLGKKLQYSQEGKIPFSDRKLLIPSKYNNTDRWVLVEEMRTSIQVASLSGVPANGGIMLINSGDARVPTSNQLAADISAGVTSVTLRSSDSFPTSYPYFVEIDPDTNVSELRQVSNNNTGTEVLTFSPALKYAHPKGAWVRYYPGSEERIDFTTVETSPDRIVFEDGDGVALSEPHLSGSNIVLSAVESLPGHDGFDYPFYLPSSWADRINYIFDRGRAAGVEIEVISDT